MLEKLGLQADVFGTGEVLQAAFVPKRQLAEELPRAMRRILEKGRENPVFVTRKKNRDRIVELNQVVYLKYI